MSIRSIFGKFGNGRLPRDRTEAILEPYFDSDFIVFPLAETAVTEAQFQVLEKTFGVKYPPEYVAHVLGRFPAMYLEVKEEVWPRPKTGDVGPFWSFLYALHTYTSAPESEPWMKLAVAAEEFRAQGLAAAPILRIVGDRDVYCTTADGSIVQFQHETGELERFDGDFWRLLEREIRDLHERKVRKKESTH
jgi:hypothetical protein